MSRMGWAGWTLIALLLSACGGERRVETPSAFPRPVIERLVLPVALQIDPAFRDYTHRETLPDRGGSWVMPIGAASVDWLTSFLSARFSEVNQGRAALRFTPAIERVEFSLPSQTGTDFFEAWIRYRIVVTNHRGVEVESWQLAAYGKARDSTFRNASDGMGEALHMAMRDATAAMAFHLNDRQKIAQWVAAQ